MEHNKFIAIFFLWLIFLNENQFLIIIPWLGWILNFKSARLVRFDPCKNYVNKVE